MNQPGIGIGQRLADVAADQWGLVTTAQARRAGVEAYALARLAKEGRLERLKHGVYRLHGVPTASRAELQAAWLALCPDLTVAERLEGASVEVVSHRSAARLHGLGDLDADRAEFTVTGRRQTRDPEVMFHRGDLPSHERTVVDGLPVTTVLRTVVDLARTRVDGGQLAGVVRDAITVHHIEPALLARALNDLAHRYGAPDGGTMVEQLVHQAGLPRAVVAVVQPAIERDVARSLVGT